MKKIVLSVVAILAFGGFWVQAQEQKDDNPTLVFGSAATPDGSQNMFLVEQPKNAPNPLGNPIVVTPETENSGEMPNEANTSAASQSPDNAPNVADEVKGVGTPNPNPATEAEALGKDFENTLMEANGRVYDIQSYPEADLKVMDNSSDPQTIYSPNVNN